MTGLRKYKCVVAAILMAVYIFIATPVQLWHHHNYAELYISSIQSVGNKKMIASDTDNKTVKDDCPVCSHHYSCYSNDDVTVFKIVNSIINSKEGFYALSIPISPYFTYSNKGPPFSFI